VLRRHRVGSNAIRRRCHHLSFRALGRRLEGPAVTWRSNRARPSCAGRHALVAWEHACAVPDFRAGSIQEIENLQDPRSSAFRPFQSLKLVSADHFCTCHFFTDASGTDPDRPNPHLRCDSPHPAVIASRWEQPGCSSPSPPAHGRCRRIVDARALSMRTVVFVKPACAVETDLCRLTRYRL